MPINLIIGPCVRIRHVTGLLTPFRAALSNFPDSSWKDTKKRGGKDLTLENGKELLQFFATMHWQVCIGSCIDHQ